MLWELIIDVINLILKKKIVNSFQFDKDFIVKIYKMSKSTPITNLPNIKKQAAPAYEERENQLVKEILNEIDNENKGQPQEPAGPTPEQQQHQQQMMQQQMMEQQMMEQQMMEQQQMQQPANVIPTLEEPKSMVDNIVDMARQPIIVAVVCILISVPQISTGLANVLNKNAKLAKYSTILLLLIKGLLGGGMYFGINKSIN